MSNNQYNNKKLAPFKKQRDALKQELQQLQLEYNEEEKRNDFYFDEICKIEKEYDQLVKYIEDYDKHHHSQKASRSTDQNQGLDEIIEQNVTKTLHNFLLNQSKKEYLESIQEQELKKTLPQTGVITMTLNTQNIQKEQVIEDSEQENGYYITLHHQHNTIDVKVPGNVRTFRELRQIVKSCCMAEDKEIFYTDQLGNLLLDDMIVLNELYPPIYELLRNYKPSIGIKIIRAKKSKEELTKATENDLQADNRLNQTMRSYHNAKKNVKSINWSVYLNYLTNMKYFLESFLFIAVLILYSIVEINEFDFFTNSQLLINMNSNIPLTKSYLDPIYNISQLINLTIPDNTTSPTFPLKSALLVQTLVGIDDLDSCQILDENQKELFIQKNQSCLNFDQIYTNDLTIENTYHDFNPNLYNSEFGGYVWEFNLSNKATFLESYKNLIDSKWIQYNIKQSQFIINYFNSPTNRIVQVIITTIYLFNDRLLNYNSIQSEAFNLSPIPEKIILYKEIIFYCSIVLLISSFFDFFGLYLAGTKNNLIVIYIAYQELLSRKKKLEAKKKSLNDQDMRQIEQKKLIIEEYIIINLKVIFITIRIPLIFDIIYILCQFGLVIRNTIDVLYEDQLKLIDVFSESYQNTFNLITPMFMSRIFSGVLVLFLMISIIRFLGNWSPYLKCYGLVMIRFNRESWFLLLVLVFIISVCAMAWTVTLQGKLLQSENFFFTFLGLLRCTLRYGMHNDNDSQGFYNTYAKEISYSFETRYLQYIIIITITFIMIPIFISLMTQQVHNTKIEAKQKMLEMSKQNNK